MSTGFLVGDWITFLKRGKEQISSGGEKGTLWKLGTSTGQLLLSRIRR